MKVKDLLEAIKAGKRSYGPEFLDWDVYTEQLTPSDRKYKASGKQGDWGVIKDSEGWEYFYCAGFNTQFIKEKIFTINVNF